MAHFAKIENGIVTEVIVAEQDFIDEWHSDETWVQTSYNTQCGIHYQSDEIRDEQNRKIPSTDQSKALRGNFAGIGMVYDSVKDKFYYSQPYASWTLNQTTWVWDAPLTDPSSGTDIYSWNEEAYQADNSTGWKVLGD